MAEFKLPMIDSIDPRDISDGLAMMSKTLTWLLNNLDSMNVTEINTNITTVSSKDGETIIDGPLLKMYDKQATPVLRLNMGYDEATDKFKFEMKNAAGQDKLYIDSNGDAVFAGKIATPEDISAGNTMYLGVAGSTDDKTLLFYENETTLCQQTFTGSTGLFLLYNPIGQIYLYTPDDNITLSSDSVDIMTSGNINLTPATGGNVSICGYTIYATGDSKLGFFGATPVAKTSIEDLPTPEFPADLTYGSIERDMLNNHQSKINEIINALQSYGLI